MLWEVEVFFGDEHAFSEEVLVYLLAVCFGDEPDRHDQHVSMCSNWNTDPSASSNSIPQEANRDGTRRLTYMIAVSFRKVRKVPGSLSCFACCQYRISKSRNPKVIVGELAKRMFNAYVSCDFFRFFTPSTTKCEGITSHTYERLRAKQIFDSTRQRWLPK